VFLVFLRKSSAMQFLNKIRSSTYITTFDSGGRRMLKEDHY
jgi:hypothetical protein